MCFSTSAINRLNLLRDAILSLMQENPGQALYPWKNFFYLFFIFRYNL